jgi:hypothetical protein
MKKGRFAEDWCSFPLLLRFAGEGFMGASHS